MTTSTIIVIDVLVDIVIIAFAVALHMKLFKDQE